MEKPDRLHSIDAVRALALVLGVVMHAALSFIPGDTWLVADDSGSAAVDVLPHDDDPSVVASVSAYVIHVFRMTLFFLMAGFFGRMVACSRGGPGFLRTRMKRIGVPLLAGLPLSWLTMGLVNAWYFRDRQVTPQTGGATLPLVHLWFLYFLLWLYLGVIAVRAVVSSMDRDGSLRARYVDPAVRFVAGPIAPVVLGAPLFLVFLGTRDWSAWWAVSAPTGIVPNVPAVVAFATAFGLGWLVHRQAGILRLWARLMPWFLVVGVGATIACLAMIGVTPPLEGEPHEYPKVAYAASYVVAIWGLTLGVTGAAVRWTSGPSRLLRYLADVSYWVYLIHMPIVLGLQAVAAPLPWPWWLKFTLILVITMAVSLPLYHYFVRDTVIGTVLGARRRVEPAAPPAR